MESSRQNCLEEESHIVQEWALFPLSTQPSVRINPGTWVEGKNGWPRGTAAVLSIQVQILLQEIRVYSSTGSEILGTWRHLIFLSFHISAVRVSFCLNFCSSFKTHIRPDVCVQSNDLLIHKINHSFPPFFFLSLRTARHEMHLENFKGALVWDMCESLFM